MAAEKKFKKFGTEHGSEILSDHIIIIIIIIIIKIIHRTVVIFKLSRMVFPITLLPGKTKGSLYNIYIERNCLILYTYNTRSM